MRVECVPIPVSDKAILWNLMQAYMAELMPFGNFGPVDGVFEYEWFELYWREPDRFPFWAIADGKCAAFALVHRERRTEMAEFYTFPEYRRSGVGIDFARQLLKRFPGPWEISQYRSHQAAVAFWHRVIAHYPFSERVYVGGQGKERLEQTFVVP
jgi:predicted acetyltransferase